MLIYLSRKYFHSILYIYSHQWWIYILSVVDIYAQRGRYIWLPRWIYMNNETVLYDDYTYLSDTNNTNKTNKKQ